MEYLPVFFDVRGRECLVVGAGSVALQKVELLRRAGARVRVVAPHACDALAALSAEGALSLRLRAYTAADMDGVVLVVAATDDREVNRRVSSDARARGLPVNVVDDPELCSFIVPAIVDRDPVVVAVSTSGASPALARQLRERLEQAVTEADAALAALLARYREPARLRISEPQARRRFFERVLASEVPGLCRQGRLEQAEALVVGLLEQSEGGGDA